MLANAAPKDKEIVRNKLRTPVQLLAHSPARHKRRGLPPVNHPISKKRVRNFLRTPPRQHPAGLHQKHRIANKNTRQKNAAKKKPRRIGAFSIQSGSGFSQLLLVLLLILTGQRLFLLVVQQLTRRLEELLLFFLEVVVDFLRQLLGRRQP